MMTTYSKITTFWKAARALCAALGLTAFGAVFAAELPEDAASLDVNGWMVLVAGIVAASWKALDNWRKNSGQGGLPRWNWPWEKATCILLIFGLGVQGCMTLGGGVRSEFSETADGVVTTYTAESKAGLFGELDTSNQNWVYEYDEQGGKIATGQSAKGLDNSGNVEALRAMGETLNGLAGTLSTVLERVLMGGFSAQGKQAEQPSATVPTLGIRGMNR